MSAHNSGASGSSRPRGSNSSHKRSGQELDRPMQQGGASAASSGSSPAPNMHPQQQQPPQQQQQQRQAQPSDREAPAAPDTVPLKFVVQEAVKRWFEDTLQEAQRGDTKQQALLGQMYAEGYGCAIDAKAAKEWSDKATARGYKMQGVYDEL
ncbi:MAG: hypothetical protein WDW38_009200 [Sanguina aurantia]